MTDRSRPTTPPTHATHDLERIAALAARDADLDPTVGEAARAQVAACSACRDLLADLIVLAAAVPVAAVASRPRDFTLTEADAARLRPEGWRRVLGFVGSARDGFTRPLAIGLTTIGLAGLLVATLPGALGGFTLGSGGAATLSTLGNAIPGPTSNLDGTSFEASAAPAAAGTDGALAASAAPSASAAPYAPAASPQEGPGTSGQPVVDTTGEGGTFTGAGDGTTAERNAASGDLSVGAAIGEDRSGLTALAILAGAILIVGLGLFGLRWTARRLGDG